jgi:hypothetical protein
MTLVVSVRGRESIWVLADRRLSKKGHAPKDDARKLMHLETTDGQAILAYAGLGATLLGTEPADWMSAVLRGRNLPLERSLEVLAEAIKKRLPPHLLRMPKSYAPAHTVITTAFQGNETRLYTTDLILSPDRKGGAFRHVRITPKHSNGNRICLGGSGGLLLLRKPLWVRNLLRLVNASDRGQVPPRAVADHLAALNYQVHRDIPDKSVGDRCIVSWRNKRKGIHHPSGGDTKTYSGRTHDQTEASIPTIACGRDMIAFAKALMPHVMDQLEALRLGQPLIELDKTALEADVDRSQTPPDDNLL